ncbi:unnamed protein product [Effrenium voratum]|uniref:Glutathione S-transferase C-terminal domain-containing protein n=1 Tax=Effrenium voratum TaxID=2562239 RepID=A0AA36HLT3_9DINO|nr:unnamed protein product [Effrenium voratum]
MSGAMEVELLCLPGSPWSSKAMWILSLCKLPFQKRPFEPMVDEVWLRYKLKLWPWQWRFWQRLTVPVAIIREPAPKGTTVLTDSFDIAAWALARSSPSPSPEQVAQLRRWNALSDAVLNFGRADFVRAALKDVRVAVEVIAPPWMRKLPLLFSGLVMWVAVRVFAWKYADKNKESTREVVQEAMRQVSVALKSGKGRYLVEDRFSYADIVMAIAVNGLAPTEGALQFTIPRKFQSEPDDILAEFQDVKAWKEAIMKDLPDVLRIK